MQLAKMERSPSAPGLKTIRYSLQLKMMVRALTKRSWTKFLILFLVPRNLAREQDLDCQSVTASFVSIMVKSERSQLPAMEHGSPLYSHYRGRVWLVRMSKPRYLYCIFYHLHLKEELWDYLLSAMK